MKIFTFVTVSVRVTLLYHRGWPGAPVGVPVGGGASAAGMPVSPSAVGERYDSIADVRWVSGVPAADAEERSLGDRRLPSGRRVRAPGEGVGQVGSPDAVFCSPLTVCPRGSGCSAPLCGRAWACREGRGDRPAPVADAAVGSPALLLACFTGGEKSARFRVAGEDAARGEVLTSVVKGCCAKRAVKRSKSQG